MTRERICICKVCHCGRAKCIHEASKAARKSSSEYSFGGFKKHYDVLDYTPAVLQRPKDHLGYPSETMDLTSSYEEEYVPMPMPPLIRPAKAKYFPPTTEFPKETEYRHNYIPKPIDPPKSMKPPHLYKPSLPFKDVSTYQKSYRPLNLAEMMKYRAVSARPPNLWEKTPEFLDKSNYQEEYRPFPDARPAAPFKPCLPPFSDEPIEGKTVYKDSFISHPLPCIKPIIRKDKSGLLQTESGLEMPYPRSIAKGDYLPYEGVSRPVTARAPCTTAAFGDEPFVKSTTYKDDYSTRSLEKGKEILPPLSDRTHDARCRIPYFTFADDTAYRKTTTTKSAYKLPPADYRRPKSYKPILKFIPPKDKMENMTTSSETYKGEYFPSASPFPQWESEMQNRFKCSPISTHTEYNDRFKTIDYWKQKREKQDTGVIETGMEGDIFDHEGLECCCRYCKCGPKSEMDLLENENQFKIIQTNELNEDQYKIIEPNPIDNQDQYKIIETNPIDNQDQYKYVEAVC